MGKFGTWFHRHILACCEEDEEEDTRPPLVIGHPTDFRREDITLPGLNPEEQSFLRLKAIQDAAKLYASLRPLHSSPSGHFATAPASETNGTHTTSHLNTPTVRNSGATQSSPTSQKSIPGFPSYTAFTTPVSRSGVPTEATGTPIGTTGPTASLPILPSSDSGLVGSLKRHSRNFSDSLKRSSWGQFYAAATDFGGEGGGHGDKEVEMRALIAEGKEGGDKDSRGSFSESEEGGQDKVKGLV